jgi:hypothetical protein
MTEQYKMGWTDPRIMSMVELFADYVATKAQVHKPWVGLTPEDYDSMRLRVPDIVNDFSFADVAAIVEARLKEKNGI